MNCRYFHCANSSTVTPTETPTNVVLAFADSPITVADTNRFCFRVCNPIITSGLNFPILLTVNGASTTKLLNKYGNPVLGSDLRNGVLYKGYFGATNNAVIVSNLPNTNCKCSRV